jgi:hypothetical protein
MASKGKGKAKEDYVVEDVGDDMEVDEIQVAEANPAVRPKPIRPAAKPPQRAQTRPKRENSSQEALERENARLKRALEDVRRV